MTQEKLVKKAIDILIHGEAGNTFWTKKLGNNTLFLWNILAYNNSKSKGRYQIFFNKKVKNMCLLSVLLRDWCNKDGHKSGHETWVKQGTKYETD